MAVLLDNFITASAHMEQVERELETARILRDNQSRSPLEPLLIKVPDLDRGRRIACQGGLPDRRQTLAVSSQMCHALAIGANLSAFQNRLISWHIWRDTAYVGQRVNGSILRTVQHCVGWAY